MKTKKELLKEIEESNKRNQSNLKDHVDTINRWNKTQKERNALLKENLYYEEILHKVIIHCIYVVLVLYLALIIII